MILEDIGELLYESTLSSISWNVFDQVAVLEFNDGESTVRITCKGVCAVVSRHSAYPLTRSNFGPECEVQYAEISKNSDFAGRLVSNDLGFDTRRYFYDGHGRASEDSDFDHPYHLALSCDAGNFDIVFWECEVTSGD